MFESEIDQALAPICGLLDRLHSVGDRPAAAYLAGQLEGLGGAANQVRDELR